MIPEQADRVGYYLGLQWVVLQEDVVFSSQRGLQCLFIEILKKQENIALKECLKDRGFGPNTELPIIVEQTLKNTGGKSIEESPILYT